MGEVHIVKGSFATADVGNGTDLESVAGDLLSVTVAPGAVLVSTGDLLAFVAPFDVFATNGIVHVIDRVLVSPRSSSTSGAAAENEVGGEQVNANGSAFSRAVESGHGGGQVFANKSASDGTSVESSDSDGQTDVGTEGTGAESGRTSLESSGVDERVGSDTGGSAAGSVDLAKPDIKKTSQESPSSEAGEAPWVLGFLLASAVVIVLLLSAVIVLVFRLRRSRRLRDGAAQSTTVVMGRPVHIEDDTSAKGIGDGTTAKDSDNGINAKHNIAIEGEDAKQNGDLKAVSHSKFSL